MPLDMKHQENELFPACKPRFRSYYSTLGLRYSIERRLSINSRGRDVVAERCKAVGVQKGLRLCSV